MGSNKMFVQIQSFEAELLVPELSSKEGGPETFHGVFIRAPAILEVGPEVEVLVDYPVPSNKVLYSSSTVEIQEVCYVLFIVMVCSLAVIRVTYSAFEYANIIECSLLIGL